MKIVDAVLAFVIRLIGFFLKVTFSAAAISGVIWVVVAVFRSKLQFGHVVYNVWWALLLIMVLLKILRFLTGGKMFE